MRSDDVQRCLDLRRADLDPELFAAAVAVHYMRRLIAAGGDSVERPEEEALSPHLLEAFLARAVEAAHKTRHFEQEWRGLHWLMPQIHAAWERGQALFQEDLARAMTNPEEMEYLSHIDFAEDCYAHDRVLQAWATNGYMLAWWQYFLAEDETPS